GNGAEGALHQPARLGGAKVAGDDQRRVGRHVVAAKKRRHVGDRGGAQIRVRAYDRVVIGVPVGPGVLRQHLFDAAVGAVLDHLAPLVLDHVALQGQLFLRHVVGQRRQAVGPPPQKKFQRGGGGGPPRR